MKKINIKGVIVSNDVLWIYELFEIEATTPNMVKEAVAAANGDDLEVIINSPGGEVFAGSEIYTILKDYSGNVTVKIVGLAASAASVIAMAGKNKVMMSPTASMMIHNASSIIRGDYRDMEHEAEVLKQVNETIINAYRLKSGMDRESLLEMMDKETWFTPQQALENNLIDEIMFDDGINLAASASDAQLLPKQVIDKIRNEFKKEGLIPGQSKVPGIAVQTAKENKKPQGTAPAPQPVGQEEEGKLEIKNADELRQHFPFLVAQVENTARESAIAEERQRIKDIDEISSTVSDELVTRAKYEEPMTAQDLALAALKADAVKGRQHLEDANKDTKESGVENIEGNPQPDAKSEEEERTSKAKSLADIVNKRRKQ